MKCCGSENRAQASETHRRLRGPQGACATAAECKHIVDKTIMRGSSWPAVVELDVAVYRTPRHRVIDLEAALREERQRSDDYEAAAHRAYGCASESHPDTSTADGSLTPAAAKACSGAV